MKNREQMYDSWLQDIDKYLEDQWRWQQQLEEEEQELEKWKQENYNAKL